MTLPPRMRIEVDATAMLFLLAVTALTGVLAGLAPALRAGGRDVHAMLKDGARGASAGRGHHRLRRLLVAGEVALALVLLVGAALMLQTILHLQRVPLGFDPDRALTFRVELGWAAYPGLERTEQFHRELIERLRALPGVRAVTFDNNLPLSGKPRDSDSIRLYGQSPDEEARIPFVNHHLVGPDYFEVMGIGLRSGRDFTDGDRADSDPVAVVSQRLAERLWPGQDPIGRRFQFVDLPRDRWHTVVGVSDSVLHDALDGLPGFDIYLPYTQTRTNGPYYVIRTQGDPAALAQTAPAVIGQVDPDQSFLDVHTYDARIAARMWQRRLAGWLFGAFAGLALLLAVVGLYGVLSQMVLQRTRDIGVRLALGAARGDILRMVVGDGLRMAVAGAVVGIVLVLTLGRALQSVLYGARATDPWTTAAVTALLLFVAALACYVPARRATAVDPLVALRAE